MPADPAIDRREEPPDKQPGGADSGRAKSLSRSRSRARTNPSELLARRQQLLAASSTADQLATGNPLLDSLRGSDGSQHEPDAGDMRATPSHAEARLESLSELLKSHTEANGGYTPTSSKSIEDVYILLAKKENDLQLAAELGKALLEKNDELSKANEHITEDYSHKLELLEQDKHKLKRQINLLNAEFENKLMELQTDCNILKNQLEEQQQVFRKKEKEKSKLIDDLVQQNQRLTGELLEATKSEELLSRQLEKVNEHSGARMSGGRDQVAHLDTLKEEIQVVNQRKQDLERRLKLAHKDRSSMGAALDESGDKIQLLENLLNEREARLAELEGELLELRDTGSWMAHELETMVSLNERLCLEPTTGGGQGEQQLELLASKRKRAQLIEQLTELRLRSGSRLKADGQFRHGQRAQLLAERTGGHQRRAWRKPASGKHHHHHHHRSLKDELERRQAGSLSASLSSSSSSLLGLQEEPASSSLDEDSSAAASVTEAKREPPATCHADWTPEAAAEIYALLRSFHTALQSRRRSLDRLQAGRRRPPPETEAEARAEGHLRTPSEPQVAEAELEAEACEPGTGESDSQAPYSRATDDSGISADDVDASSKRAARTAPRKVANPVPWRKLLGSLQALIEEMPCTNCQLMIKERADYELLQKLHARLADEARLKGEQVLSLSGLKTEQEAKLAALEQRCQLLSQDLKNCDMPKEEIVKLAWRARDEAVERKNAAEISLAKTRIENMQISSQLMEVVQQKGELSLKLAQFEDDIHYITQHSVKAKFTWEEYAEKLRRSKSSRPDSASSSSNPLAQLLSGFSSVASARNSSLASSSSLQPSAPGSSDKSSPMAVDNASHQQQPPAAAAAAASSLMRNFTSNRFNLRFWQRNSSEKQAPNAALPVASHQTTTATTSSSSSSSTSTTTAANTPAIQQQESLVASRAH